MLFSRPKVPVQPDEFEWLLACYAWLRQVLDDGNIVPSLVLPGDPRLQSARTGQELFETVRDLCGMSQWDCRLELVPDDGAVDDAYVVREGASACGTFSIENGEAVIRYSASMLRDPDALAATFAHELCHYLLAEAGDPPGGPDLMEHSTDCAACYLGFGVLLANSARNFAQWSEGLAGGWAASTQGYLSEAALVTGTALFLRLHDHPVEEAAASLKPYMRGQIEAAYRAIGRTHPDLSASLSGMDLLGWNYA